MILQFGRCEVVLDALSGSPASPAAVHALASTWFDDPTLIDLEWVRPGSDPHKASVKPYTVTFPYETDNRIAFEVRTLDERVLREIGTARGRSGLIPADAVVAVRPDRAWSIDPITLLDTVEPSDEIRIRLETPTVIRHRWRGNSSYPLVAEPLPEPRQMLLDLRAKWNLMGAPPASMPRSSLPSFALEKHMPVLTHIDVVTADVPPSPKGKLLPSCGFVGEIGIGLVGRPDRAGRWALAALASIAPWTGCGAFTGYGFGAADVIK